VNLAKSTFFSAVTVEASVASNSLRAASMPNRASLATTAVRDGDRWLVSGRLTGDLMKTHKGQIEAADVKRIAEELLSSSA